MNEQLETINAQNYLLISKIETWEIKLYDFFMSFKS